MPATAKIYVGDVRSSLARLPERSVQTCVTSPPYFGLRDYGVEGQIGAERTPDEYVASLVSVFRAVRRVLADDGTLWLNLGDSYARNPAKGGSGTPNGRNVPKMGDTGNKPIPPGIKPKELIGIPWMVAFALRADGWFLRSDIVWSKPNPMPESVKDRPTRAHEYIFLLTKSSRYYYDADAIREPLITAERKGPRRSYAPGSASSMRNGEHQAMTGAFSGLPLNPKGRNARSVWTITPQPYKGAHFATFPVALPERCLLAGSRPGDTVLDAFNGAATTGVAALTHGRHYVGCELKQAYADLSRERLGAACEVISHV